MATSTRKFSEFAVGGDIQSTDIIVGLRAGVNTQFLAGSVIPPSIVPLDEGGTSASLVANNGGIFYSTATTGAILNGTPTANQVLLSGASSAPNWSSATYPATTTINQILYSSANNVISGLPPTDSSVFVTSNSGVPTFVGALSNGQIIIGSTGATPVANTITAGAGVTVTNGAGTITISAGSGLSTWSTVTTAPSPNALVNNGYVANSSSGSIAFLLPPNANVGDTIAFEGLGSSSYSVVANTGQTIKIGLQTTSSAGSLTPAAISDNIYVRCIVQNTTWRVTTTNSNGLTIA